MLYPEPPELWDIIATLILSTIGGTISITRRIVLGYRSTALWVISEFMTAILCGYLMYSAYPVASQYLPEWFSLPIAVAVASHSGGRIFQQMEDTIVKNYTHLITRRSSEKAEP